MYQSLISMNPTPATYVLQILHGHFTGFHCLIFLLNSARDLTFLISPGTRAHIFGPMKPSVSIPYDTVLTFLVLNGNLEQCSKTSFRGNTWFIISGDNPLTTLYNSIAKAWMFLNVSWKSYLYWAIHQKFERSSLYTIRNALSWILLILLFNLRLWNIQTKGQ